MKCNNYISRYIFEMDYSASRFPFSRQNEVFQPTLVPFVIHLIIRKNKSTHWMDYQKMSRQRSFLFRIWLSARALTFSLWRKESNLRKVLESKSVVFWGPQVEPMRIYFSLVSLASFLDSSSQDSWIETISKSDGSGPGRKDEKFTLHPGHNLKKHLAHSPHSPEMRAKLVGPFEYRYKYLIQLK